MNRLVNQKQTARKRILSGALAIITAACFCVATMLSVSAQDSGKKDYKLAASIQEGTILHCFNWTFNDIKGELDSIAESGFTSVQISPVQPTVKSGTWLWLYQPVEFSINDESALGTKEELKELCEAADAYGINIIADVVANHLAFDKAGVSEKLLASEYWHDFGEIKDYNKRNQITLGTLKGLPDLNTENLYIQELVLNYINELKEAGVKGIRWDAAKHIALPSEGSEFWKKVTDTGLYNYGEIIGGPSNKSSDDYLMAEYTEYMSVTDTAYGNAITARLAKGSAPVLDGNWDKRGVSADKLLYWGESHDTYVDGSSGTGDISQNVIDRAYAITAARNGATSLYLSRPYETDKYSILAGEKGSTHYTSPEVAAVNRFHNEMAGKADCYTMSNNCGVVTRKDGGAVIVCGSGSGDVSVENGGGYVPSGVYKDEVSGNTFTVTENTISGKVGESGIAVIYNRTSSEPAGGEITSTAPANGGKVQTTTAAASENNGTKAGNSAYKGTVRTGEKNYSTQLIIIAALSLSAACAGIYIGKQTRN